MKTFCETINGLEECVKGKALGPGLVLFDKKVNPDRCMYSLYEYVTHFKYKTKKDLLEKLKKKEVKIKGSYAVRCNSFVKIKSKVIEKDVGAVLKSKDNHVDFSSPSNQIFVYLFEDTFLMGKLIWEKEKSYLLKANHGSITPVLASCVLRYIGYTSKDVLVNPLCKDGVIGIEAKLLGGGEVICFDKMSNVKSARVNAKLAGVDAGIFEVVSLDWVDTKLGESIADKIVSIIPSVSKRKREKYVKLFYEEFITSCEHLVKSDGEVCVIVSKPELFLDMVKFKLIKRKDISIGKQTYSILHFAK
tara:strand:- start:878 stop:1789 length:912 start_codon:yes stop_codon:yes gene_type:complete